MMDRCEEREERDKEKRWELTLLCACGWVDVCVWVGGWVYRVDLGRV